MERTGAELEDVESLLADTSIYAEDRKAELSEVLQRQARLKAESDSQEERWLALQEELERLQGDHPESG